LWQEKHDDHVASADNGRYLVELRGCGKHVFFNCRKPRNTDSVGNASWVCSDQRCPTRSRASFKTDHDLMRIWIRCEALRRVVAEGVHAGDHVVELGLRKRRRLRLDALESSLEDAEDGHELDRIEPDPVLRTDVDDRSGSGRERDPLHLRAARRATRWKKKRLCGWRHVRWRRNERLRVRPDVRVHGAEELVHAEREESNRDSSCSRRSDRVEVLAASSRSQRGHRSG